MADQSSNKDQGQSTTDTALTAFGKMRLSEEGQSSNEARQSSVSGNTSFASKDYEDSSMEADSATTDDAQDFAGDDIQKLLGRQSAKRSTAGPQTASTSGSGMPERVHRDIRARRRPSQESTGGTSAGGSRVVKRRGPRRTTSNRGDTAPQSETTAANTNVGTSASQESFLPGAPIEEEPEEMQVDKTEH